MQLSPNLRGIFSMLLSGFSFVSGDSFLKLMLADTPPFQTLILRGIFATVFCFGLVVAMGQLRHLAKAFNPWTVARSLAEVLAVTSFIVSLAVVPLATITAIYQVAPLVVLIGASILWAEKIGPLRWVLILLGLAGAVIVAQPWQDGVSKLALLGFFTAFASAIRDLLSRKTPRDSPGIVVAFSVVVLVMLSGVINNQIFEGWQPVKTETWLYGIAAGFFVMLGQLFVFLAFRYASARTVAPFYYSFTLIAATYGALIFREYPNWVSTVGMVMIIACGLGVLYFESDERAET